MTGTEGQDWANYQVATPSTAGLGFVFVKATEGTSYVNPKHDAQVAHGRSVGLVTGHYHFQRPGSPTAQASYFLTHAKPKAGDVLACDWEDPGVSCADKDAFIRALQHARPDLRTVLYANRDYWLHRDTTGFAGDGLWIADPSALKGKPRVSADWVFHQYGSPGGLDRNYTRMTLAQLRTWAAGTLTPQQEDDVSWNDKLTTKPGPWTDTAVTATGGDWLMLANLKAGAAARDAAKALAAITAANAGIAALANLLGDAHDGVDTAQVVAAVQEAIADAVVHVTVDVTGDQADTP